MTLADDFHQGLTGPVLNRRWRRLSLKAALYGLSASLVPKMVDFANRSGAYFKYASTGSAESRHLQAGIT
jgi:hypothetical protein